MIEYRLLTIIPKKSFGQVIKDARNEKKLTQSELAVLVEVTRSTVCGWEGNKKYPRLENLRRLSEVLDLNMGDMVRMVCSKDEVNFGYR